MGYSYETRTGRLCCDVCDKAGDVRKYKCPFGYCPAIALCPDCKAKHPEYVSKAGHRKQGCEKSMNKAISRERREQYMLDHGMFIRCSALSHHMLGLSVVKVIFRNKSREEQAFFMAPETYHAIPLLRAATVSDYEKYGKVTPAVNTDIYDPERERVLVS
jgi:hypothetical protein